MKFYRCIDEMGNDFEERHANAYKATWSACRALTDIAIELCADDVNDAWDEHDLDGSFRVTIRKIDANTVRVGLSEHDQWIDIVRHDVDELLYATTLD